jgi:hypothetical protein
VTLRSADGQAEVESILRRMTAAVTCHYSEPKPTDQADEGEHARKIGGPDGLVLQGAGISLRSGFYTTQAPQGAGNFVPWVQFKHSLRFGAFPQPESGDSINKDGKELDTFTEEPGVFKSKHESPESSKELSLSIQDFSPETAMFRTDKDRWKHIADGARVGCDIDK